MTPRPFNRINWPARGNRLSAVRGRSGSRRAFTLLEILLALTLVSLVLVAMNSFVFSMGELWGRNADVLGF